MVRRDARRLAHHRRPPTRRLPPARLLTAFQIAMTLRRIDEHNSPARRSTNLIVAACPRGPPVRAAASMQVELVAAGNSSC